MRSAIAFLPFVLFVAACGEAAVEAACVPGEQPACGCPGGEVGIQTCKDDGTFSACACPDACVPRTCDEAAAACGPASDGCGGTLACGSCDADRVCAVDDGGNTCVCAPGTVEIAGTCDLDECATGIDNCDSQATCTNTAGGFTCACADGTVGDGIVCDEDQCANGTDTCALDATCTDLPTGFLCVCLPGFVGNGQTCTVDGDNAVAELPTPVSVTIANVGGFFVSGLSRIALVVEPRFAEEEFGPPFPLPSIAGSSTPPVTLARVAGDATEAAALVGEGAAIHDVDITLTNVFGERVSVRLHALVEVTDPTITVDGSDSVVGAVRVTPLEALRFLETVSAPTQNLPAPPGGVVLEISGITGQQAAERYTDDELTIPPVGGQAFPAIRNVHDIAAIATWMNEWVHLGISDRRSMSFVDIDGTNTEVGRLNCYEGMPTELVLFNPAKVYGTSLLGDFTMATAFCEDAI